MSSLKLLPKIESAIDLKKMSIAQLNELGGEIRSVLCNLLSTRTAHFASNLGVVELCLALHSVFDFRKDRLIWDTGHQIYPHKLITGRYSAFNTIRTKGGLMGYPNPHESEYDLFMTGHAGSSVSTVLGLHSGDMLLGQSDRHSVAVIGDGAFPSGIVFEALNNAALVEKNLLVILNDNKMSICPRVGGMASYLDRLRTNPFYTGMKKEVINLLNMVPVFGDPVERFLGQVKEAVKCGLHGGMMFEDLGFRYLGPIDGHNISLLRKYLELVKTLKGPILLHVVTEKGHGFKPAEADPVYFHTPPAFKQEGEQAVPKKTGGTPAYTNVMSEAIRQAMHANPKVTVLTAAMCQGNKLECVRDEFQTRFFDTGICEGHAVAFAGGMAKAGARPIVDIYSTFLQRSFDQIFQEAALQNLPVVFTLDRAGLCGPDGPTHHGVFDNSYMRVFPNIVIMAPGDERDVQPMLDLALTLDSPSSIRYPKTAVETVARASVPLELGHSDVYRWGEDGNFLVFGAFFPDCVRAAERLRQEGLDIGVINARFLRPLDNETIFKAIENGNVVTVEENSLNGGFGSAVLEAANDAGLDTRRLRRLGIPDRFIEHGERGELLAELGLDLEGLCVAMRALTEKTAEVPASMR